MFGADGTEYVLVDQLERIEVERLLKIDELDFVVISAEVVSRDGSDRRKHAASGIRSSGI